MEPGSVFVALGLASFLWLVLVYGLRLAGGRYPGGSKMLTNVSLLAYASVCTFLLLELVFSTLFITSDGFGMTLASRKWFDRYWKPVNSFNIRDVEHRPVDLANREVLFVVGDSFAAGHGIKDYRDRFSAVLAGLLGAEWEVVLLAMNGWETPQQFAAMRSYPQPPDRVILSYYLNDIHYAAVQSGYGIPELVVRPRGLTGFFVDRSYLINRMYWRIYRRTMGTTYWDYLRASHQQESIWWRHRQELGAFVEFSREKRIPLLVMVWPHLGDIEGSRPLTARVADLFRTEGIPVFDVADEVAAIPLEERIVNPLDVHPSVLAHRMVAEKMYKDHREFFTLPPQKSGPEGPEPGRGAAVVEEQVYAAAMSRYVRESETWFACGPAGGRAALWTQEN